MAKIKIQVSQAVANMSQSIRMLLYTIAVVGLIALPFVPKVRAGISNCAVSLTPHTVAPNSLTDFVFTITNNDTVNDIQWIKFLRPSADFTIQSVTVSGWSAGISPDGAEVTLDGNAMVTSESLMVTIRAQAGSSELAPSNWSIYVSDSPDGSGSSGCSGDVWTEITSSDPFLISNVSISNITASSATINWTTNRPSSTRVDYGLTISYGSSAASQVGEFVTSHTVTLQGLSASTAYHYRVASSEDGGPEITSSDNTFLTIASPPTTSGAGPVNGSGGSVPIITSVPIKAIPTEKTPPTIKIDNKLSGAYKTTPTFSGTAQDNEALAAIEYSIDGGKNWLPVDSATGLGGKTAIFSFTPKNLDDGDYKILARAIDTSGNQGLTSTQTLVIDKLPPIVGGNVVSLNTQIIEPNSDGTLVASLGVDQKITLNAVGGANSIKLTAKNIKNPAYTQTFNLTHSEQSGLWSGILSFGQAGTYQLTAEAVDGAGNTTIRQINKVIVEPAGRITDASSNKPIASELTVYYKDPETNNWVLWDSGGYGQTNPAKISEKGEYSYFLPGGTYYIRAKASGHKWFISRSFTLDRPSVVARDITLNKKPGLSIGSFKLSIPWLDFLQQPIDIQAGVVNKKPEASILVGKSMPNFNLPTTNGQMLTSVETRGRPTILTFMSTWSPPAQNQLAILNQLEQAELNVIPVGLGESQAKLAVFAKIAGYKLPILADSDQRLADPFAVSSLPTHYFIDRHGVVKKVVVGVLSSQELLKNVGN